MMPLQTTDEKREIVLVIEQQFTNYIQMANCVHSTSLSLLLQRLGKQGGKNRSKVNQEVKVSRENKCSGRNRVEKVAKVITHSEREGSEESKKSRGGNVGKVVSPLRK